VRRGVKAGGSKEIGKKRKHSVEQTTTTQKPQQPYTGNFVILNWEYYCK
jgi:hypothetical protein